ncbi:MAG: BrnA antitoxin family protein [Candidatus Accumulibacter sp.]|jgi:uncharacterized protein (DUF4415 family)|nr:BrnA antitoxin family protein [Accumulibacter sp.]
MKSNSLPDSLPTSQEDWARIIAAAPGEDREPSLEEVAAWEDAFLSHSYADLKAKLAARRRRGAQKAPVKERVTLRLSPNVVQFFKATGAGWQTRMDGALQDWLKTHSA